MLKIANKQGRNDTTNLYGFPSLHLSNHTHHNPLYVWLERSGSGKSIRVHVLFGCFFGIPSLHLKKKKFFLYSICIVMQLHCITIYS